MPHIFCIAQQWRRGLQNLTGNRYGAMSWPGARPSRPHLSKTAAEGGVPHLLGRCRSYADAAGTAALPAKTSLHIHTLGEIPGVWRHGCKKYAALGETPGAPRKAVRNPTARNIWHWCDAAATKAALKLGNLGAPGVPPALFPVSPMRSA